jgi:hypothetical protein
MQNYLQLYENYVMSSMIRIGCSGTDVSANVVVVLSFDFGVSVNNLFYPANICVLVKKFNFIICVHIDIYSCFLNKTVKKKVYSTIK